MTELGLTWYECETNGAGGLVSKGSLLHYKYKRRGWSARRPRGNWEARVVAGWDYDGHLLALKRLGRRITAFSD